MRTLHPDYWKRFRAGWLLVLDPELRELGGAVFHNGELQVAVRIRPPGALAQLQDLETGERCRQIADLTVRWARSIHAGAFQNLVYEKPKVYRAGKSKGDPDGMIKLALVCGGVANAIGAPTLSVEPGEWAVSTKYDANGKTFKDGWASPRGRIIRALLEDVERSRVDGTHDAIDAAGLGLWALGRLGHVFPGTV